MLHDCALSCFFEGEDIDLCARMFSVSNGIPFEQLDLAVFSKLVDIGTIDDVSSSPLFLESAKAAFRQSHHKAVQSETMRVFSTQGIVRPLVLPTKQELEHPSSKLNFKGFEGWQTASDHPFFSTCVLSKFLQFCVAPSGQLRFLCDMAEPKQAQIEIILARRLVQWNADVNARVPAVVSCIGTPPPPEYMLREQVVLMSRLLVMTIVGGGYGDDKINERIKYAESLVRNADRRGIHPFFASADIDDGDLYVWQGGATAYADFLLEQSDFCTVTKQTAVDISRIQNPTKKAAKRPVESARTNKKKAKRRPSETLHTQGCAQPNATCPRKYIVLRWQATIRQQIKLNRMHRMETAKHTVERMRREQVRGRAEATRTMRTEPPFSAKGPSGPAPKQASGREEMPTAADRAKRECRKAESLQRCDQHCLLQKEKEDLRISQIMQKLEALHTASLIQQGD